MRGFGNLDGKPPDASLGRCDGHVHPGGDPGAHIRHVADVISPGVPENTWDSPEELVKGAKDTVWASLLPSTHVTRTWSSRER